MSNTAKALFVVCLVINCVLWSQSRYAQPSHDYQLALHRETALWKRTPFAASFNPPVNETEVPTQLIMTLVVAHVLLT